MAEQLGWFTLTHKLSGQKLRVKTSKKLAQLGGLTASQARKEAVYKKSAGRRERGPHPAAFVPYTGKRTPIILTDAKAQQLIKMTPPKLDGRTGYVLIEKLNL